MVKDRDVVELVDLPAFGRQLRLLWHKHRWACPSDECSVGRGPLRSRRSRRLDRALTDRAGRWDAEQVGRRGRIVNEIAVELGCDWHTVNDAVIAYGTVLVGDDPERIGEPTAAGLDESTVRAQLNEFYTCHWVGQFRVRRYEAYDADRYSIGHELVK